MIAVDWGSTSFRAYRLNDSGDVLDQRSTGAELRACEGRFAEYLAQQIRGWDDGCIFMAGMIGSRNGWSEVPYVACPSGLEEIAAGLREVETPVLQGRRIFIAPGVSHLSANDAPEVMRGEETQLLGLIDRLPGSGPHVLCLPGTHSKWVRVEAGRIIALRTAMTGELYALLRRHSVLAALIRPVEEGELDDVHAFTLGVGASGTNGGLLHHLFGVRSHRLFESLGRNAAPSYLSGLLIGHELRGLLPAQQITVHLIGRTELTRLYERALGLLGAEAWTHDEALTARGLHRLASKCGATA